jgi:hypothetical protein
MKAPELPTKIYFTILDMGSGYVYTPSLDDNGGTEYIRKDVLLEWLKPEKDISFPDDYERGCIDGRNGLRGELIDKLNSM